MRLQHRKAQHLARPCTPAKFIRRQQLMNRHEIPQALGHFLSLDLQKPVMHPHIRHARRIKGAAALRNLVLVMRKHQINPAAMNIKRLTQISMAHRRAFNMPARAAINRNLLSRLAERRRPSRLRRGGFLPQHEIRRVALMRFHSHPRALDLLVELAVRQCAIGRHRPDRKQHLAPLRACSNIGMIRVQETLDNLHHLLDIVGRPRLFVWLIAPQRLHIRIKLLRRAFRHLADRLIERQLGIIPRRAIIDLVIHIRNVPHIFHMVRTKFMAQQPEQHIKHNHRSRIADMGKIIHGRPAHIHPHIRRIDRREGLFLAGQRIVKRDRHGFSCLGWLSETFALGVEKNGSGQQER